RAPGGRGHGGGAQWVYVGQCSGGSADAIARDHGKPRSHFHSVFDRPSAETQPRCGVALDGVKRLKQTLVPRARQAPDGRKEGGSQSTDISRINRRLFLAPPLPMHAGQKDEEHAKESVTSS